MNKQPRFNLPRPLPFSHAGVGVASNDMLLDIKAILRALRRRLVLAAVAFLTTFFLVALYTFQQIPTYSAAAHVKIETRENRIADFGAVLSGLPPNTAIMDTEVEVIQSKELLSKVVPKLDLTQYAEFNWRMEQPRQFGDFIGDSIDRVKGLFSPEEDGPPPTEEALQRSVERSAVRRLQSKVHVQRLGPTYIIEIRATSQDPQLAAQIANAVADQYLVEQLEAKLDATRRANEWLSERLAGLRDEVNRKENAVEIYRAESGLLSAQGSTLTEQQIAQLQTERSNQEAELREAEARLSNVRAQMRSGDGAEAIAEVLGSQVIGALRAQQAEVQRERADLLTRYGPRHPEVLRINNELADLRSQIDDEVGRIVASLENDVAIARERVQSFDRNLVEARSRLASNNRAQVRLRELEREAEASRALYEDFLERFKQTSEQDDLAQPDARVITSADVPGQPSAPRTTLNLFLGLLLGGVAAGGFVLLAELGENFFSSGSEIERAFGVPAIGSIPLLTGLRSFGRERKSPADYAIENPLSAFAESMRNLRASIIFADLDNPAKTVAVCSSLPNEGKTMTTYSLGRLSAMSGSRTLVIDGDFRRRQLTEAAGLEPEAGLIEHLFGEIALEEAIKVDEPTGLHILPLSNARNTPRDVFGSRAFDMLLQRLQETYDLIIIDTGPLLLMAESRVIVSKVDQVIVVAKWRATKRAALQQSMNLLSQFNANVAGVVLNFVDLRKKRLLGTADASYKAYSKYYTEGAA